MRILLCHNHYQRPGGEDQVFHDERWLLESHGHQVFTYTRHNDDIKRLSRIKLACGTLWNRAAYRDLRSLIRRHRPAVMHCTNIFPLISPAAYAAARAENVPVVQSLHNYRLDCANGYFLRDHAVCEDCLGRRLAWPALRHACYRGSRAATAVVVAMQALHRVRGTWQKQVDCYIACSAFARDRYIAGGVPADRIVVKPNFVHPDDGPGPGDGGYAVFVGRLSPEKGVDTLLRAWQRLRDHLPLKIIGDGPLAERVANAAAGDDRIEWLGWQPLPEVLRTVGQAAMLVMPSVWNETFGRTVIEAFAKGTPVVASRIGALTELVDEGRTGALFAPGDADDLARQVIALWQDAPRRASMRAHCRAEFERNYTPEENYRQLMAVYHRVQGRRLAPSPVEPVAAAV